jgi:hypothetical protein
MTPETYIERLWDGSGKKLLLLQDLYKLTVRQSDMINQDKLENLDEIIGDKQKCIDQIDKLDEEFNVYFLRLKQQLNIKNLDELHNPDIKGVKELKLTIGTIIELIKEISTLEQQNNLKAKSLLDELGKEIKKINQGKKVTNAYNPGSNLRPPSYYIDKKE